MRIGNRCETGKSMMEDMFDLDGGGPPAEPSVEAEKALVECPEHRLSPDDHARLERLLIGRLKERQQEIRAVLDVMTSHWGYEDVFYRYYHGSFKVYRARESTGKAVALLRSLMPERNLNRQFEFIISEGSGKEFTLEHNRHWSRHTRPILEAFAHARFMIEMAVRYCELHAPPRPLPSGWAALLYLYNMR